MTMQGWVKISLLCLMAFSFIGCAGADMAVQVGTSKAAGVADKALGAAEWYMCNGASIGAVRRRFGTSPEAYRAICEQKDLGVIGR